MTVSAALDGFRAADDQVWEARARHNLGYLALVAGRVDEAGHQTSQAAALFERSRLHVEAVMARQNLGEIAYVRGDLPSALAIYSDVAREYDALGENRPHLATARCQAYLAAGPATEAAAVVDAALAVVDMNPVDRATLQMWGAPARLDGADPDRALELAATARAAFRANDDTLVRDPGSAGDGARPRHGRARAGRRVAAEAARGRRACSTRERADEAPVALIVASRVGGCGREAGRSTAPRRTAPGALTWSGRAAGSRAGCSASSRRPRQACCARAAAGWTRWTTIVGCSAARSCVRWRLGTAWSSPRSP